MNAILDALIANVEQTVGYFESRGLTRADFINALAHRLYLPQVNWIADNSMAFYKPDKRLAFHLEPSEKDWLIVWEKRTPDGTPSTIVVAVRSYLLGVQLPMDEALEIAMQGGWEEGLIQHGEYPTLVIRPVKQST